MNFVLVYGFHVVDNIEMLSVHWNTTGQTALEPHWLMLYRPVVFQWQSSVNLHNWNTGRPLEPQLNWDATETTLADASAQWYPSDNPVLICIIGTHWISTGRPLEDH